MNDAINFFQEIEMSRFDIEQDKVNTFGRTGEVFTDYFYEGNRYGMYETAEFKHPDWGTGKVNYVSTITQSSEQVTIKRSALSVL